MSADNGYILRRNAEGMYVLQMYWASADTLPSVQDERNLVFARFEDAILFYAQEVKFGNFISEYGLTVDITQPESNTMTLDIQDFERLPFPIKAVQVTEDNMIEVAKWCGGEIRHTQARSDRASAPYIKVRVHTPMTDRQSKAFVGDWVSVRGQDFKVYTSSAFERNYGKPANSGPVVHQDQLELNPIDSTSYHNIFSNPEIPKPGPVVNHKVM
jgi:hypothetical protein